MKKFYTTLRILGIIILIPVWISIFPAYVILYMISPE